MMYQWVREDIARVRLALVIGLPFLLLLALRAFGEEGASLLRILVGAASLGWLALATKWVVARRAFAREDAGLEPPR